MGHGGERVAWVDSLRFLGMLAIYVGHFGEAAGRLYPFVFSYHVPLFFFAAGFFAGPANETVAAMALRLVRRLLLPYVFFALLFAATLTLFYDWPWPKLQDTLFAFSQGIRNHIPAGSLWFLPCLFVVALAHGLVLRATRSRLATLAFGIGCLLVARHALSFDPVDHASLPFNADSALYYVFWYALGHALFPAMQRAVQARWFGVLGAAACLAAAWAYFNGLRDIHALANGLPQGFARDLCGTLLAVLAITVLILANVAVARAIEDIAALRELGRRTLVLCGLEDFVKLVLSQLLLLFGLKLQLIHPLGVVMYSIVALCVAGFLMGRALERHAPLWTGLRAAGPHGRLRAHA
jgi:fucose 4-O-acetylase-like acetyltransferase